MNNRILTKNLRTIPNFPKEGIMFRDVTSWFENPLCVIELRRQLVDKFRTEYVDKVVCIESRGFVAGSILAERLKAGIVLARKSGKLPTDTVSATYEKEYGTDTIEMRVESIKEGDVVVIHDDLLATGGTAMAVYTLVKMFKPSKVIFSFLIEITDEGLHGRDLLESTGCEVHSILKV